MRELSPIEWAIRPFKKYASFSGRASRAEYWWFYLATIVLQIPLTLIDKLSNDSTPFSSLFTLATLLPWVGVTIRRLHDIDRTGWWLLGFALAVILGTTLIVLSSYSFFGPATGFTAGIAFILFVMGMGITFLAFMVTRGTEGSNRYGPDPYGPDALEEVFA